MFKSNTHTATGMFYLVDNFSNTVHIFPTRKERDHYFDEFYSHLEDPDVTMDYVASTTPMTKEQAQLTAEYKWSRLNVINHY